MPQTRPVPALLTQYGFTTTDPVPSTLRRAQVLIAASSTDELLPFVRGDVEATRATLSSMRVTQLDPPDQAWDLVSTSPASGTSAAWIAYEDAALAVVIRGAAAAQHANTHMHRLSAVVAAAVLAAAGRLDRYLLHPEDSRTRMLAADAQALGIESHYYWDLLVAFDMIHAQNEDGVFLLGADRAGRS